MSSYPSLTTKAHNNQQARHSPMSQFKLQKVTAMMDISDSEASQVIVVVEAPSPASGVVNNEVETTPKSSANQRQRNAIRNKSNAPRRIAWELLDKVPSTAAFHQWLKKKEALGMRYGRKKTVTSQQGALDYYGCLGHGCAVVLEVLFDNSSEDVVINYNGKQHTHKEKQHSGWGLPEKTKMEVQRWFDMGVTTAAEVEARLRRDGHGGSYTSSQIKGYILRLRKMSRDRELTAYTGLSAWSRGSPRAVSFVRTAEQDCSSSPPADYEDAHFSDDSSQPRRKHAKHDSDDPGQPVMDEAAVRRLAERSIAARAHSYSPYSRFPVGAALLCADGQVVTGCNVENASFGLTNCAERTAVFKAVSEGRREFTAIAIAAEMGDKFVGPCGACRQVLAEFNAEMPVILTKPNGEISRTNMKELLPMAFLPSEVTFKKA